MTKPDTHMKSGLVALALLALPLAALAAAPTALAQPATAAQAPSVFERDRQSILAMAGDYRVRFDFRETVSFVPGYEPIEGKISGGYESVRVVEDTGRSIALQHILVMEHEGKTHVIKHWRQDWVYEPAEVLTYRSSGEWVLRPVSAGERAGAWSQTVWQTDDSPRYGGVGRWAYDNGVARWTSDATLRPLARRDAVRKPVYGHYVGTNRHALTPAGWVHEQDNAKVGTKDGQPVTFVHEVVLNTYKRSTDFPAKAADAYWSRTGDYWAAVRQAWADRIARQQGVTVVEEAENGSVTGPRLMGLADEVDEGRTTTAVAVAAARKLIAETGPAQALAAAGT